jgi:hypothetical protein
MRIKTVLFVFFLLGQQIVVAQSLDYCQLIDSILSIDKIGGHLQLDTKKNKFIRIYDSSRFFKNCNNSFKTHSIIVINKLPLDFNAGRHIDLAITKMKREKKKISISVFYSLSGQSDKYANLWAGDIEIEVSANEFKIIKSSFYNIQ